MEHETSNVQDTTEKYASYQEPRRSQTEREEHSMHNNSKITRMSDLSVKNFKASLIKSLNKHSE